MAKPVGKLARRYARAFVRAVQDTRGSEGRPTPAQQVAAELDRFIAAWNGQSELSQSIVNPMFEKGERQKALAAVAEVLGLSDIARRLLDLVFERDRIPFIEQIVAAFKELADEAAGVVHVEVSVARRISDEERRRIEDSLRQKIAGSLSFVWNTRPELLGGMVIRFGGKVIDGSLQGRLERIERALLAA